MKTNLERESTNSITHLVKIVANEVFDKRFLSEKEFIMKEVDNKIKDKELVNDLCMRGKPWTNEEENRLKRELDLALEVIGHKHGRTAGAIIAKLRELRYRGDRDAI